MKTLADHLKDVMIEMDYQSVDWGCYGVLEKVAKRSKCKIEDTSLKYPRPRLNWIIHRVMETKRGRELFKDIGYISYGGIVNRPCRVISLIQNQMEDK